MVRSASEDSLAVRFRRLRHDSGLSEGGTVACCGLGGCNYVRKGRRRQRDAVPEQTGLPTGISGRGSGRPKLGGVEVLARTSNARKSGRGAGKRVRDTIRRWWANLHNPNTQQRKRLEIDDVEVLPAQKEKKDGTLEDIVIHPGRNGPSAPLGARPNDKDRDKPIKRNALIPFKPKRLNWTEVRWSRKDAIVDEELFGFLSRKALNKTRDRVTLLYLTERADRWFNEWNQSGFTDVEIATIMAYTIAAVMTVPEAEQRAWHLMGGLTAQENIMNATRFGATGRIPESGLRVWMERNMVAIQAFFGWVSREIPNPPNAATAPIT